MVCCLMVNHTKYYKANEMCLSTITATILCHSLIQAAALKCYALKTRKSSVKDAFKWVALFS